jgi:hypothetical protein
VSTIFAIGDDVGRGVISGSDFNQSNLGSRKGLFDGSLDLRAHIILP